MSLFLDDVPPPTTTTRRDYDLLHQMQCRACPLNQLTTNKHPHMEPTGSSNPLVYLLGEAPGKQEDKDNEQFVGESGLILRARIPRAMRGRVRLNNVVRTRPLRNRTPTHVEVECCRPSIVADIERTKPRSIIGLGNVPLEWVSGLTGIFAWRGRRMPVRVGQHVCWYYPVVHPAFVLRQRRYEMDPGAIGSEDERMFALDMKRAFAEAESLPEPVVHDAAEARRGTDIITGREDGDLGRLAEALAWAADLPVVGIDYETRGLRPYAADAVLLSAAVSDGDRSVAFAIDHPGAGWDRRDAHRVRSLWEDFLRASRGVKVAHNLAFELEWTCFHFGKDLARAGEWECTQVQASILDERSRGSPSPQSLDFLTQQHFGFSVKDVFRVDRANLYDASLELVLHYNAPDAKYAALLWERQGRAIADEGLGGAYDLGMRRVPTVVLTQLQGVPVDQVVVRDLVRKYDDRVEELEREIAAQEVVAKYERKYGGKYNPLSPQQTLRVFHEMLGRRECQTRDKYTKKPKLSVDSSVLEQIDHPLARLTLDLRRVDKLRSTYAEPLREGSPILYPDGLVHTSLNTTFAETGRLSSDSPNMQNIPKRSDEGREIRRAFVAPPGHVVLAFDYGQIEARVIAMLTQDERFCRALWERYDVHMDWARRIAHACPAIIGGKKFLGDKDVMKKLRSDIKGMWTFALFFGAKLPSVAGYLGVDEREIRHLFDDFWDEFSGVRTWQEDLGRFYRRRGYVECATGRRRRGPLSVNKVINSPVQGTAAEIVMDGMCRLSETGDPELQPDLNIHDDLTWFRVRKERVDDVAEKILDHMLDVPFDFVNVPITVEMFVGTDWMHMEEVDSFSSDEWFGQ